MNGCELLLALRRNVLISFRMASPVCPRSEQTGNQMSECCVAVGWLGGSCFARLDNGVDEEGLEKAVSLCLFLGVGAGDDCNDVGVAPVGCAGTVSESRFNCIPEVWDSLTPSYPCVVTLLENSSSILSCVLWLLSSGVQWIIESKKSISLPGPGLGNAESGESLSPKPIHSSIKKGSDGWATAGDTIEGNGEDMGGEGAGLSVCDDGDGGTGSGVDEGTGEGAGSGPCENEAGSVDIFNVL